MAAFWGLAFTDAGLEETAEGDFPLGDFPLGDFLAAGLGVFFVGVASFAFLAGDWPADSS